jgi:hypothetical protein
MIYKSEAETANVPIIPMINLCAPESPIKLPLTSSELFDNYFGLIPKPKAFIWYNLKGLTDEYM